MAVALSVVADRCKFLAVVLLSTDIKIFSKTDLID